MRRTVLLLFAAFFIQYASAKTPVDTMAISISPNPSSGAFSLTIQTPRAGAATVKIYTRWGQLFYTKSLQLAAGANQANIDISHQAGLKSDVYILTIAQSNMKLASRSLVINATPTRGDSIDIESYNLNLTIRNLASKTIGGYAELGIMPKVDSLTTIRLDLLKLGVTRVMVDSVDVSFSQNDSTLFVTINKRFDSSQFALHVEYNGHPVTDASWGGFYFNGNYAFNMGVAFSSDPHNFGRCWFPCVDNFTDRATYEFHITTDSNFVAVCNGLKQPEATHPDGSITWNWHLLQPIPTYLASVAVGKYAFVKHDFVGMNRTYPVWVAVEPKDTLKLKASFAKLNGALQCFEQKFGPYPFDRVGYVGVPFNAGAMEHAGNIAYPLYAIDGTTNSETLFAHELSHMWWGDQATCRTAQDMWLNEGWASFCEALFLECMYGKDAYLDDLHEKLLTVMKTAASTDGGFYPVSGIPTNITYGTHVYKKGALMVHSLRTVMGDSSFFAACRSYLIKNTFKDVSSETLKDEFQLFTSVDLSNFFQHWIYEEGNINIVATSVEAGMGNVKSYLTIHLEQLVRYKNGISKNLPVTVTAYDAAGHSESHTVILPEGILDTTLIMNIGMDVSVYYTLNEKDGIALGKTLTKQTLKASGTLALPDVLASINVQQITDSAVLVMEHHWTGPTPGSVKKLGIRISPERYWRVDGILPASFKTFAYFNYDGTTNGYLDRELITQTEDSLMLLYRPAPNADWQIHTDNTFQPGGSKTDKIGRFWVNDLKKGDYAFGMRDASVVGLKEVIAPADRASFRIIPNPASGAQTVLLQFDQQTLVHSIRVIDSVGKEIASYPVHKSLAQYELPVSQLKHGNYVVVIGSDQGSQSKSFVK
jgi:hypothetical protein